MNLDNRRRVIVPFPTELPPRPAAPVTSLPVVQALCASAEFFLDRGNTLAASQRIDAALQALLAHDAQLTPRPESLWRAQLKSLLAGGTLPRNSATQHGRRVARQVLSASEAFVRRSAHRRAAQILDCAVRDLATLRCTIALATHRSGDREPLYDANIANALATELDPLYPPALVNAALLELQLDSANADIIGAPVLRKAMAFAPHYGLTLAQLMHRVLAPLAAFGGEQTRLQRVVSDALRGASLA